MQNKPTWHRPGIEGGDSNCHCCPSTIKILNLKTKLYYSGWIITRNGKHFFHESFKTEFDDCKNVEYIESLIADDDKGEFLAVMDLPLRSAVYQRHLKNYWVLVEIGNGYA